MENKNTKSKKHFLLQQQNLEVSEPLAKKAKIENTGAAEDIVPVTNSALLWIRYDNITLDMEDKNIISSGGWLNDRRIDFAQALLKSTFKDLTGGLQSALIFGKQATISLLVHSRCLTLFTRPLTSQH